MGYAAQLALILFLAGWLFGWGLVVIFLGVRNLIREYEKRQFVAYALEREQHRLAGKDA